MLTIRACAPSVVLTICFLSPLCLSLHAQNGTFDRDREGRQESPGDAGRLAMTKPVACRAIEGFENYETLPRGELTADEKLHVYYRPLNYKIVRQGKDYMAHLAQDGQIRRRGEKAIIRSKKNILDYQVKQPEPLQQIFMRNSVSLKGLLPGDYEYDIILRDENNPGPSLTQSLKFRIIAPVLSTPEKRNGEARQSSP